MVYLVFTNNHYLYQQNQANETNDTIPFTNENAFKTNSNLALNQKNTSTFPVINDDNVSMFLDNTTGNYKINQQALNKQFRQTNINQDFSYQEIYGKKISRNSTDQTKKFQIKNDINYGNTTRFDKVNNNKNVVNKSIANKNQKTKLTNRNQKKLISEKEKEIKPIFSNYF